MVRRRNLAGDRRGAVGLMFGAMAPALLGVTAILVDTGFWFASTAQLQMKADAAAMGVAYLLQQASFLSMDSATQGPTVMAVAQAEALGVSTRFALTIGTPSISWSATTVTVTLNSQTKSYFAGVFNIAAPRIVATAVASLQPARPCLIALGAGLTSMLLDNTATVSASLCGISINGRLTLNSGSMTGTSVGVAAGVSILGGANSLIPPATVLASLAADPYAGQAAPSPGACASHPDYTRYGTYVATPGTWCGSTKIGGNGSTISFSPGVYYVVGDLTFDNASVTSAQGVTFIVTGSLAWTNYSGTATQITAPTTGPTAGIAFWQPCGLLQSSSFQGGSTLQVGGAVYAPCSAADLGNNTQVSAASGQSMSFIAASVHVHGSASLRVALGSGSGGSSTPVLIQ